MQINVIGFLGVALLTILTVTHSQAELKDCRVAVKTKMRMFGESIEKGALAVLHDGTKIGLEDILSDAMIHFQQRNGEISTAYQWMYSRILKVQGRTDKHLSTSYGEDVVVTVGEPTDPPGKTTVNYWGTRSGNYLTLDCNSD